MKKARTMQAIARRMTIVAIIGAIGSFGAIEHQQIAWSQAFLQVGIFSIVAMVTFIIDRNIERRIHRWRKR